MKTLIRLVLLFALLLTIAAAPAKKKPAIPPPHQPTEAELQPIRAKTGELSAVLKQLAAKQADDALLADVEVYHKAAVWIVRYASQEFYSKRYVADTLAALDRGLARAQELAAGKPSWPAQKGRLVRAYRSRVDGSVQPYGVIIPDSYDNKKPLRLDVVLHGRGATLNEVSFIASHDSPKPVEQDYITLEVFGRVNNAYRWAGETDVFEAIESVKSRYKIDERRIVLRGFSMGGAGAWHLGLHHPDKWAAVEAGAGFTDTKRYAKQDNLPPWQETALHIYDATDYALNAFNVPLVAYVGEDDPAVQSTVYMREALMKEGFKFRPDGLNWLTDDLRAVFLVGPKTPHRWEPESKKRSDGFIHDAVTGARTSPSRIRFTTWTTRYNKCAWLLVDALEKHYARAEVDAQWSADRRQLTLNTKNVTRLVLPDPSQGVRLTIDGKVFDLQAHLHVMASDLVLEKEAPGWTAHDTPWRSMEERLPLRKKRGLQGPIDDAFMEPFLCVRPTKLPFQPFANERARATLDRFAAEFPKWMRGDLPLKDDGAVTGDDIANHNLILFGDPASNWLIGQIAARLPIRWTRDAIVVGNKTFSAADHALAMIYPNPLNPRRYVVLNSGHTFGEKEFRGTNALLFPRLGDFAVLKLTRTPAGAVEETVVLAGFFDERWQLPPQ